MNFVDIYYLNTSGVEEKRHVHNDPHSISAVRADLVSNGFSLVEIREEQM